MSRIGEYILSQNLGDTLGGAADLVRAFRGMPRSNGGARVVNAPVPTVPRQPRLAVSPGFPVTPIGQPIPAARPAQYYMPARGEPGMGDDVDDLINRMLGGGGTIPGPVSPVGSCIRPVQGRCGPRNPAMVKVPHATVAGRDDYYVRVPVTPADIKKIARQKMSAKRSCRRPR